MSRERLSTLLITGFVLLCALAAFLTRPSFKHESPPDARADFARRLPLVPRTVLPPHPPDLQMSPGQFVPVDSGVDVALLYRSLSGARLTEADYQTFAAMESYAYRAEGDGLKRAALLQSLTHSLDARYAAYQHGRYCVISQSFALDAYDPNRRSFPISATLGTGVDWLYGGRLSYSVGLDNYVIQMTNAPEFGRLVINDAAVTRDLNARIGPTRAGRGRVYFYVEDVIPTLRTLRAEIIRVQLLDAEGRAVAQMPTR